MPDPKADPLDSPPASAIGAADAVGDTAADTVAGAGADAIAAADSHYRLGQIHLMRQDVEEALGAFQAAIAANPRHHDARFAAAYLFNALGRNAEARTLLHDVIAARPDHADAHHEMAKAHHAGGQLADAQAHLRRAIAINPDHVEAIRDLGSVLTATGAYDEAETYLQRAVTENPDDLETRFFYGILLNEQHRFAEALPYLASVHQAADTPATGNNYASTLLNTGNGAEARKVISDVLARNPDYGLGWFTLGVILQAGNDAAAALEAFDTAARLGTDTRDCRKHRAKCLITLLHYRDALDLYRALETEAPDDADIMLGLGTTLEALGRSNEALPYFEALTRAMPEDPSAWNNLAVSLYQMGRYPEAITMADRALALDPGHTQASLVAAGSRIRLRQKDKALPYLNAALRFVGDDHERAFLVGEMFESINLTEQAAAIYSRILDCAPDIPKVKSRMLDASLSLCDWSRYDEFVAGLVDQAEQEIAAGRAFSFDVFNLQALPVSYAFMHRAARVSARSIAEYERQFGEPYRHARRGPSAGGRIRLGYLLPYTNFHSLPLVLKNIVAHHDRDRFEVIGLCTQKCDTSTFSRDYRGSFDRFVDLPGGIAHEAARLVHEQDIDVLIDVAGLTSLNCMNVLAHRPAPVQAHFLGYSITTGADYVDYLITDRIYVPPEWQAFCSEKTVYLPDTFMATTREDAEALTLKRAHFDLPEDGVVFANFNHPCKFEPKIFAAWMRILDAVPGSVMWFGAWTDATQRNLKREAAKRGIDPDRLVFSDIVDRPAHLTRLALADLALDNLYHGGGITTVDALWVGLPVLTICGDTPGARLGATLTAAAGLPEAIVDDLESYVATAIALAGDPARLQSWRRQLQARRDTCPLFDIDRYRTNLEQAIVAIWRNFEDGKAPRAIDIAFEIAGAAAPATLDRART